MKLSHGLGFLLVSAMVGGASWVGCSSSTPSSPSPDGGIVVNPDSGGMQGQDSGGMQANDSGGTPDAGGNTGDSGGGGLSCTAYCTAIQSACTGGDAQYQSTQECMNACALFPVGAAGDSSGNTLGCRVTHTALAAADGGAAASPHCWHAGPYGAGVCGGTCEDFCALTLGWCDTANGFDGGAVYASSTACTTACGAYALADAGANPQGFFANGPTAGNTLDCREYHLGNAMNTTAGSATQALHCPHAGSASAACQ